ncbi:MAG: hypothetical protein JWM41_2025 [Gemmatimonadetes bacterium]|nr:hypothetical protein [Gemmatimonadota bacterium]
MDVRMKRIVVCADGTWNIRDKVDPRTNTRRPTNVTKVARAVLTRAAGIDQVVFYHEGVGTGSGMDKYSGGAFGDGIENNVRDLYRSIVYNYEDGDELYFFGFSRGAFTVRTLAGFMNAVGLIHKGDDYLVPELYACYREGKRPGSPEWAKSLAHLEYEVRACPPITFIGVWDTVGALGPPGVLGQIFKRNKYAYHDIALNDHIQNACQALAIDERRKPFAPSVWDRPSGWTGKLQQAWFAGVHSDVGGSESPDGLANQALHWMVEQAEAIGLAFDTKYLSYFRPCFNGTLHDSMSTMYRVMGPITRAIGAHGSDEAPHQSSIDRRGLASAGYAPVNLADYLAKNPAVTPYATKLAASRSVC